MTTPDLPFDPHQRHAIEFAVVVAKDGVRRSRWVDATQDVAAMTADILQVVDSVPGATWDDWFIDESDGFRAAESVIDDGDLASISALAQALDALDDEQADVLSVAYEETEALAEARRMVHRFRGKVSDGTTFARDFSEGLCDIPSWLEPHINWEGVWNDIAIDFQTRWYNGEMYVFHG